MYIPVNVVKQVHPGTREKRYVSVVGGKHLRLSWQNKKHATIYAMMIRNRYVKKLIVANNKEK